TFTAANVTLAGTTFFVTFNANTRGLHSFPTRRSSDLDAINGGTINTGAITIADSDTLALSGSTISTGSITGANLVGGATPSNVRSEEHTAELQSPCKLVCSRLLEKTNSAGTDFKSTVN